MTLNFSEIVDKFWDKENTDDFESLEEEAYAVACAAEIELSLENLAAVLDAIERQLDEQEILYMEAESEPF